MSRKSKSPVPASKPPKFHEDPVAQKADKLKAIEQQRAACKRLELREGNLKGELKLLRQERKEAERALANTIDGISQAELFEQAAKEMAEEGEE